MSIDSFSRLAKVVWNDISDIRELNPMQFLVAFFSSEAMLSALFGGVLPVSSFYSSLKRWSMDDWLSSRFVWVEVSSLPPSACSGNNMVKIGSRWDKVRGFDERTIRSKSLECARMLIATNNMESIDGHVEVARSRYYVGSDGGLG